MMFKSVKSKLLLLALMLTLITSSYAVPNDVKNGRWSDDFNQGSSSWNKTGMGTKWENKTITTNFTTQTEMLAKGDGAGEGFMSTLFDARGYDEANITFRYKTTNLGAGDYFQLKQRNVSNGWQTKFNTNSNSGGWKNISRVTTNQSFLNSSQFMIQLVCQGTTPGDKCWVDDVDVKFKLHNPALIVVDKDSNIIATTQQVVNNNPIVNKTGKIEKVILDGYVHNADSRMLKIQENLETFSLGLSGLRFDTAVVSVNKARADGLSRCIEWNFTSQTCDGTWVNIRHLDIGDDYNFSAMGDYGYAEINLSKAYHLDSSKTRIKEITSIVYSLDNVTRQINDSQYAEFHFNRNLTQTNAIKVSWKDKSSSDIVLSVFDSLWNLMFTVRAENYTFQRNLPLGSWEDSFYLSVDGNISDWLDLDLIMDPNTLPVVSNVVVTSTSSSITEALKKDNLTVTFDATDSDGNKVINITDWRMNGTSAAILYFPFEADLPRNTSNYASTTIGQLSTMNGPVWDNVNSPSGGSYYCDGLAYASGGDMINRSIVPEIDLPASAKFSMSILINASRVAAPDTIFNIGSDNGGLSTHFIFRGTGNLCFDYFGTSSVACTGASTVAVGKWYSIVGTYDGSKMRIYQNGKLKATQGGTVALNLGNGQINICNWVSQGIRYNGYVDEVQVWNRTLTLAQIVALNYSHFTGTPLVIHNSSTKIGEVWNAAITPNDGIEDGTTKFSNNITIVTVLSNTPPTVTNVILNSTHHTNLTTDNLTVYWSSTDIDADKVINITDWRVNGKSIAVLNMPFENNTHGAFTAAKNVTDYSIFGNNGTITGATWNATGGHDGNGEYVFNGLTGTIIVPDDASLELTKFTISAWVNPKSFATPRAVVTKTISDADPAADNYQLTIDTDGTFLVFYEDTDGNNFQFNSNLSQNLTRNRWAHIAVTADTVAGTVALYKDGKMINSTTGAPLAETADAGDVYIGSLRADIGFFNGSMDDVQIYNRSLSPQQVYALFSNRTDLIVSQETTAGQNWSACITPNDGMTDGNTVCSNNVTIRDTTKPIVFDAYPRNGTRYNYSSTVTISVNATDDVAVSQVWANLTGRNGIFSNIRLKRDGATNKYNNTYSLGLTRGRYNITYLVNDTSNNKNFTVKRYFNVSDGVKPLVTAVYPINIIFNTQTKIDIKANISDIFNVSTAYANITTPSGTIDRLTLRVTSVTMWNNTYDIPASAGRYFIRFIANDTSNNINSTVITNFTVVSPGTPSVGSAAPGLSPGLSVVYANTSISPDTNETIAANIATYSVFESLSATISPSILMAVALLSGLLLVTQERKDKKISDREKQRRRGEMESDLEGNTKREEVTNKERQRRRGEMESDLDGYTGREKISDGEKQRRKGVTGAGLE